MTGTVHARFTEWDAAYVLGALSPAERRDYEDHLDGCERCRAAVTELSAMPGLLGRLGTERGLALLEEPELVAPPADLVQRVEARERRRRSLRRIRLTAGLAAAAAIAAVLALVLPSIIAPSPAFAADMVATAAEVPVEARVALTPEGWGTRIDMDCRYHPPGGPDGGYGPVEYSMWVIDRAGASSQVSTWTVSSPDPIRVNATTGLDLAEIAGVEVRDASGSQVLLAAEVPEGTGS
ncbi:MAG TPA: zf-HC2 domain-containing protein [Pseudolysinimonas sp.]|nr:zf-HC2 domain-containing protein [Pseudolysinimonas sp.]